VIMLTNSRHGHLIKGLIEWNSVCKLRVEGVLSWIAI